MLTDFTRQAVAVIRQIPEGRVLTYGRVAALAGSPGKARQVAWLLHSMSRKYELPWHRVINARGKISLPEGRGYHRQKAMLESEGIRFSNRGAVDLKKVLWMPV